MRKRIKIIGIVLLVVFILLFFLSSIARSYIQKHSEELIGRKIELRQLHFNYLRVSVQWVLDFHIYFLELKI